MQSFRGPLTCHSRYGRRGYLRVSDDEVYRWLGDSGISHLDSVMFESIDSSLISAFVERWQPETNSFHLPFGEMTITLHDVYYLLKIPVEGKPLITTQRPQSCLGEMGLLLGIPPDLGLEHKIGWKSGRCKFEAIEERVARLSGIPLYTASLLWLLGTTLFVEKTTTHLHTSFVEFLHDPLTVSSYAWGAAALANMYRQLGEASRSYCKEIAGCLTLLQVCF